MENSGPQNHKPNPDIVFALMFKFSFSACWRLNEHPSISDYIITA